MSQAQEIAIPNNVSKDAMKEFASTLRGQVVFPEDPDYESARKIWNGMIDKHPAMIVRCAGVSDVINAIKFSRKNNIEASVRGGGHNVAGNAICDNGMVIDLSRMKSIRVDPLIRTARAEPGVVWKEFDRESQEFGLATTGGLVSSTGIAGFTLGGGIGWLVRKYGSTSDNLVSADVVTANGEFLSASAHEHPDLFWGLRGGGGNFGVVTSFEYKLHPVGQIVLGGLVIHPVEKARELLKFYREFVRHVPDELTTIAVFLTAPPAPFLPPHIHNKQVVAVAGCYCGPVKEGESVLKPLREFSPPAIDLFQPFPYRVLQSFLDEAAPFGLQNYWKSGYLSELSDQAIETIVDQNSRIPSPLSAIHLHHLGGAFGRMSEEESAFSHRDAQFALNIPSTWSNKEDSEKNIQWTRDFFESMKPFTSGVYVNFLMDEGEDRVKAAYSSEKYARLAEIKKKYDPTNFFHLNQNIKPS
jgi:FAD/FMN-containing dehydrogenase